MSLTVTTQLLGEAEVHHFDAVLRRQHDVARLQIAVHDVTGVRRFERFGNLASDPQTPPMAAPGSEPALKRLPRDQLHHDE